MSIQRLTPWAATAVTVGSGYWASPTPETWPLDVTFQHVGSLQCLLVSLPGLSESLIMQVFPPPGPRLGFCSSPLCILFGCGSVALPMQAVPWRGQDVLDCLFSLPGLARQFTRQPSQQVYAMVEVSDLFVEGPVSYMFYGRYIFLWVWPG